MVWLLALHALFSVCRAAWPKDRRLRAEQSIGCSSVLGARRSTARNARRRLWEDGYYKQWGAGVLLLAVALIQFGPTTAGAAKRSLPALAEASLESNQAKVTGRVVVSGSSRASVVPDHLKYDSTSARTTAHQFVATKPGGVPTPAEAADLVKGAKPVGSALKSDAAHRAGSFVVDDIASNGSVFRFVGGDGVTRTLVQTPGELNSVAGRFEWIVDGAGNLTHQMFVKGGSINSVPIKP